MRKHVHRILCAQRDVLSAQAIEAVNAATGELDGSLKSGATKDVLHKQMENLEKIANKWLKPYPNAAWRENVEVLLVALAVAMGIRTFFLQPFKIPTGSMQPTLFGVTSVPDFSGNKFRGPDRSELEAAVAEQIQSRDSLEIPTGLKRVKEWFEGISYLDVKAKTDGMYEGSGIPQRILIFNIKQTFWISGVPHTIWFPPDYGSATLDQRAGLRRGQPFRKGESVVHMKVQAGDHLFVDRISYNFRKPSRGDIIVFATAGTRIEAQDQFYIKRLVGLSGETISVEKEYDVLGAPAYGTVPVGRLVINGQPLSSADPRFANVYSFPDAVLGSRTFEYHENHYCGHAQLADLSRGRSVQVGPNDYFAMGDNTLNSADSRYWGDVPGGNVIGKSCFVYWPITGRFGWGHR